MQELLLNPYLWMMAFALAVSVSILLAWKLVSQNNDNTGSTEPPFSVISEIVEQERTRISSELHDELGTLLSVIHLDLELVMHEASSLTPYGENRLAEVKKNLMLVTSSIRNNIWNLSAQMFDEVDLTFIIRELCHKLDAYKGTHITFIQSGTPFNISEKVKLNMFRIVQELLTNALKHSSAWNIGVHLHWDRDQLSVTIDDDGTNYRESGNQPKGGVGIINISKRASYIGATITKQPMTKGQRILIEVEVSPTVKESSSVIP